MTILFLLAMLVAIVGLVAASYQAVSDRAQLLQKREAFPLSDWETLIPSLSCKEIKHILDVIGSVLEVDSSVLRPEDTFEGSLALRGMLMIDDDTIDDVADQVEEQLGVSWEKEWKTVQDAVEGIGKQLV
jgi:hypothetical protein